MVESALPAVAPVLIHGIITCLVPTPTRGVVDAPRAKPLYPVDRGRLDVSVSMVESWLFLGGSALYDLWSSCVLVSGPIHRLCQFQTHA